MHGPELLLAKRHRLGRPPLIAPRTPFALQRYPLRDLDVQFVGLPVFPFPWGNKPDSAGHTREKRGRDSPFGLETSRVMRLTTRHDTQANLRHYQSPTGNRRGP